MIYKVMWKEMSPCKEGSIALVYIPIMATQIWLRCSGFSSYTVEGDEVTRHTEIWSIEPLEESCGFYMQVAKTMDFDQEQKSQNPFLARR